MRTAAAACAVLVCSLLAACSSSPGQELSAVPAGASPSVSASASGTTGTSTTTNDMSGMDMAADPAQAWGPAPSDGVDSALRLEALLGQHSVLAADMMRARIRGDADLAQSANAALTSNTQAMATLLAPVAGTAGAASFSTLWAEHIRDFFTYAGALADRDKAAQSTTLHQLTGYETRLAGFFASASHGRLARKDAVAAVKEHIEHLVIGAKAYADKDYQSSAKLYRLSYAHTYDLGATLASAILPSSAGARLRTAPVRLRTALTKVLGEHVALVIAAMRAAPGDPADFSAMGSALNGNTLDLAAAIDSLFGSTAAKGFQGYWSDHVDELLRYTSAAIKGDQAGQQTNRDKLRSFETGFGAFMNTATQNRLGARALVQAFVSHDRMLLAEIDAYAAKNYQEAQNLSYQTYVDMFTVSAQLSKAIGATLAGKLPQGGSQTGGGGTAP